MLSADVADAIEALVGPPERRSLPVAFDKNAITHKSTVRQSLIDVRLAPTSGAKEDIS